MLKKQMFAKKSLRRLLEEMAGEDRLHRVLGPVTLTALGVGAVIGAGIFVATGSAAREVAGPALMASYAVAGLTCIFAALCYAEFASMAPVAGSAYTYAYTTLGELFAWIIGWDLVLEYAVGAATVANGWSGYFQKVLNKGLAKYDLQFSEKFSSSPWVYVDGNFAETNSYFNLPAVIIVAIMTMILVKGIRESAGFNALMVFIKTAAVLFVIFVGVFYINPENWEPFAPFGWGGLSLFGKPVLGTELNQGGQPVGMLAGAAIIFFAYIGFDSVSTHAEEAKNPQRDVPIGIIASLIICTILYIAVVAVLTGMVPYSTIDKDGGDHFGAAGDDAQRSPRVPRDGPRRTRAAQVLRRRASEVPHAVEEHDRHRHLRRLAGRYAADRRAAAPYEHRHLVRIRDRLRRSTHHA